MADHGTRVDPYAAQNPLEGVDKPAIDVGQCLDPESYDADTPTQAGPTLFEDGDPSRKLASDKASK